MVTDTKFSNSGLTSAYSKLLDSSLYIYREEKFVFLCSVMEPKLRSEYM